MDFTIAPGVFDIIPNDKKDPWRSSYLWHYVEEVMRKTAHTYGFQEWRTPIFERTELFKRGVGEETDIVGKEMYTFEDRGGRSMTLRPEGTAAAMRALIESGLLQETPVQKIYYIAPMFRYERNQAGRYRQHHQFGVEAIGTSAPEQDVEVIDLIFTIFNKLGLKHLQVSLNSLGDSESRANYRTALVEYLKSHFEQLSPDSKTRLEKNPLRVLDSKDPGDKAINAHAPSVLDYLSPASKDHFEQVQKLLKELKIPYKIDKNLVRGLDYYNKTVFEVIAGELGAQNSITGGGRYDGLLKLLGGPDLPAFGFGAGIERILQTLLKQEIPLPMPYKPILFLIALGDAAKERGFRIVHELRQAGISAQIDFSGRKVGKLLQAADNLGSRYTAVLGDNELQNERIELKKMDSGEKMEIPLPQLSHYLQKEIYV